MDKIRSFLSDLNRLEKKIGSLFFAFRAVLFYLYFFLNFFRFSVFLGLLLRQGHNLPTPKLNWVKNGLSVLFAKKIRVFLAQY